MNWNWCQRLGKHDFWANICSIAKIVGGDSRSPPPCPGKASQTSVWLSKVKWFWKIQYFNALLLKSILNLVFAIIQLQNELYFSHHYNCSFWLAIECSEELFYALQCITVIQTRVQSIHCTSTAISLQTLAVYKLGFVMTNWEFTS